MTDPLDPRMAPTEFEQDERRSRTGAPFGRWGVVWGSPHLVRLDVIEGQCEGIRPAAPTYEGAADD